MTKIANEVINVEDVERYIALLKENVEICTTRMDTCTDLSDKAYQMGLIVGYSNAKYYLENLVAVKKYIQG